MSRLIGCDDLAIFADKQPTGFVSSSTVSCEGRGPIGGTATAVGAALLLTACGSGNDDGDTASTASAPVVVIRPTISNAQASRFLAQSTMGASKAMIADVIDKGYEGWVAAQFALPRVISHWDWLVANGYNVAANINATTGYDVTAWRQLIVEPDQLRQRMGMALLDILVLGIDGVNLNWKQFAAAAYLDVLLDNAFGNFRDLLGAITTNAAMASFLTFLGNRKANTTTGAVPDENYARELMQLFTLGLYQLNMDGSVKTSGGVPLETYGQADVSGLARVFTGLSLASTDSTTPDRYRQPLVMNASLNEVGSVSFLGTSVSGGGMAAIKSALDTIFQHPNLPPFLSRQLIQRLVASNPSAGYVGRVAAKFADNGSGVRGDLKVVIAAILLDQEARSDTALTTAGAGKLREPVMRLTAWARGFAVTSPSNAWGFGDTSNQANRLGQSPGRSQTVFNFFRPGYAPPSFATIGLVAPEFQITNEQSVIGYINYMYGLVANGTGDTKADYTEILTKAADTAALVDEVNLLLAAGQLSATTIGSIRGAVDSISPTATNGPVNRVGIAIVLTLAAPEFLSVR